MDREAAVLRAEMSRTRAGLDEKLALLEQKVNDMTPRRIAERYLPDRFADRAIGGVLTLIGLKMAWSRYRELKGRREKRVNGYVRLQ